ncbi:hypothetical protein [Paenibacillus sp. y28]|uniref:hypothetical protein n=1 Tax=Paenibacillus sp. y28 TaxID=3129110 RepID=UPI003017596B
MWPILGIVTVTIGIAVMEGPSLWRKQYYRDFAVFSFLLLCGAILSILQAAHVALPNPIDAVIWLFKPVSDMFTELLQ